MLKRVVVDNYRSCLHTSINIHPHLSVLIGPNGSGKTNILQAITLLSKMTREEPFSARKGVPAVTSRVNAVFENRRSRSQLRALIASYSDRANNDVLVSSRQKWVIEAPNEKSASFEMPLAILSRHLHGAWSPHYFRYQTTSGIRLLRIEEQVPKWVIPSLTRIAEYCSGIKYYSASQFTNPGSSPASFQIEEEERGHRRLTRFSGHEKVLYSMYSAQKEDSSPYNQFIEIVGPRGLRLIDHLTFREVRTSSIDYSVRVGGKIERRKRNRLLVIPQFRIGKQRRCDVAVCSRLSERDGIHT